jgi:predicted amidophosphoribosyltransferase
VRKEAEERCQSCGKGFSYSEGYCSVSGNGFTECVSRRWGEAVCRRAGNELEVT